MQPCNCRRDETILAEPCSISRQADLREPGLVPSDFLVDVEICSIVDCFVSKSVGNVVEGISVRSTCKPRFKGITISACRGVRVFQWRAWPQVRAGAERLLELKSSINLVVVLNRTNATISTVAIRGLRNVSEA